MSGAAAIQRFGAEHRLSAAAAVGLTAVVFSALYVLSDVIEAIQGGFSAGQLWLTLAAEAAVPVFVIGLYLVQRPCIGRLGRFSAVAYAYVTTDLNDWNLNESLSTWGGGTQFHISSGTDGWVSYRWLDSPNKTTVISGNSCSDWALLGSASAYGAGDTSYHGLFNSSAGQCFVMRGRTASGQGSMVNHDGRVQR